MLTEDSAPGLAVHVPALDPEVALLPTPPSEPVQFCTRLWLIDTAPLEVAVRRLAEDRPEDPAELRGGEVGDRREGRHVERLGVAPVHLVAGAQPPPVEVLARAQLHGADASRCRPHHRCTDGYFLCTRSVCAT